MDSREKVVQLRRAQSRLKSRSIARVALILIYIYIAIYVIPFLRANDNLDLIRGIVFLLWLIVVTVDNMKWIGKLGSRLVLIVLFLAVYLLYVSFGFYEGPVLKRLISGFFPLISFALIHAYYNEDKIVLGRIVRVFIFCIGIGIVSSFFVYAVYPDATRILTGRPRTSSINVTILSAAGGFGFVYAVVLLWPILFYLYKQTKHILYLLLFIASVVLIVKANLAIAIILMIFCGALIVYGRLLRKYKILAFLFLFCATIIIVIGMPWVGEKIYSSSLKMENIVLGERFQSIGLLLMGSDTENTNLAVRLRTYIASMQGFKKNPIFGNGISYMSTETAWGSVNYAGYSGNHSEWFDMLAQMGIFGFGLFATFIYLTWRVHIHKVIKNYKLYFVSVFFSYLLLGGLNPVVGSPEINMIFFLIMPSAPFVINKIEKNRV